VIEAAAIAWGIFDFESFSHPHHHSTRIPKRSSEATDLIESVIFTLGQRCEMPQGVTRAIKDASFGATHIARIRPS